MKVLLLAGTTEARRFAELAAGSVDLTASLAGRTAAPAAFPCPVRVGGFGGVEGLVRFLDDGGTDVVVDATHPFASVMPWHAAEACAGLGRPRMRLLRPPWTPGPGDVWDAVPSLDLAAVRLGEVGARRVFLALGRQHLAPFAGLGLDLVVRAISPVEPPGATVVLGRGPFDEAAERALLREHRIDTLVCRNSGGDATEAKLVAARHESVRVVMVDRPPTPPGPVRETPEAALAWLRSVR